MTENFKVLSDTEFDQLKDAIALIAVYISGADGEISKSELQWAEKIASIRSYKSPAAIENFYSEVEIDFQDRVNKYLKSLNQLEIRNKKAEEKLSALNPILAKLDPKIGATLYKSYLSFATHIAKASGGFLGFFSISPEEKAILDLKMIHPIEWDESTDHPIEHT